MCCEAFSKSFFRLLVFALLVIGPTQGIQIGSIGRVEIDRLLDHGDGFIELYATIGQHVTEIVQSQSRSADRWLRLCGTSPRLRHISFAARK